jgi:hypothetical protein
MKTARWSREQLASLLTADAAAELEACLLANSGLPGPRGNLELAHALADLLDRDPPRPAVRARLERWRALSSEQAPTGDPREFLSFCGALALSADWPRSRGGRSSRAQIARGLRKAAGDPRWRMREAAAMALQRIGEADPVALLALLAAWLPGGSFLELRAVVAALAHPPLLEEANVAREALRLADGVLSKVAAAALAARREEDFRVLRQGLGYALSVLAAAEPDQGFALLERWAARRDPDVAWILRENLKKKRLACFPEGLRRVSNKLGGS